MSSLYCQPYHLLRQELVHCLGYLHSQPEPGGQLRSHFLVVKRHFQAHILPLAEVSLDGQNPWHAYTTEVHKQLRLLETDISFWQTARRIETRQERHRQMGDRLKLLLQYCDAVLEADGESEC